MVENTEKIIRGIWDILKTSNICVIEIPKMKRGKGKISNIYLTEKFLKLLEDIKLQNKEIFNPYVG